MKDLIYNILDKYPKIPSYQALLGNDIHTLITEELPREIKSIIGNGDFIIKGHDGNGNKATIPWVGIHYKALSPSPSQGVYIALLFSKNGNFLNISINQGTENDGLNKIRKNTEVLKNKLFENEKIIPLELESKSRRPKSYAAANLFNIKFEKEKLQEEELQEAIKSLIKKYYAIIKRIPDLNSYNNIIKKKKNSELLFSDLDTRGEKPKVSSIIDKFILKLKFNFPDFKTFSNSGKRFWENEDAYKRNATEFMHDRFDNWVQNQSDTKTNEEILKNLISLIKKTNFIDWRAKDSIEDVLKEASNANKFRKLLHSLLKTASTDKSIQAEFDALGKWTEDTGLKASISKLLPTYLLSLWNPDRFIFIKPSIFDNFLKAIDEKHLGQGTYLDFSEYDRILRIMHKVKNSISELKPRDMIDIQTFYYITVGYTDINTDEENPMGIKEEQEEFNINHFIKSLESSNLKLEDSLLTRFISSIQAKPFVLLTGLSGSGKTKLAQFFSSCICESSSQYELVAVGADWTNNENLLGYPDALNPGVFRKPDNGALDLILRAKNNPDYPYFLILDEMNLSHVERYFADFLSAMESEEQINLHDGGKDDLWPSEEGGEPEIPGKLSIPKNLFVIGTVNVDETTYMFSPKVLDRANVIEFRVSDKEMKTFLKNPVKPDLDAIAGKGAKFAKDFVMEARQKDVNLDEETRNKVSEVLRKFFPELQKVGAEFGYRSAHEICRFIYFYKKLSEDFNFNTAMDAAIMQKLLPKLHGSKKKLGPVLETLIKLCASEVPPKDEENKGKYPVTMEKLKRMQDRLNTHGFTSFAEA